METQVGAVNEYPGLPSLSESPRELRGKTQETVETILEGSDIENASNGERMAQCLLDLIVKRGASIEMIDPIKDRKVDTGTKRYNHTFIFTTNGHKTQIQFSYFPLDNSQVELYIIEKSVGFISSNHPLLKEHIFPIAHPVYLEKDDGGTKGAWF